MKKTTEQYFRFPRQLLESAAWSVLNIHEHRAFDRIMIEHQSKSGYINDGLIVTFRDFLRFGVHPRHVAGSLRVLRELGIIECTRTMGGSRSGRTPNMWKPTFLPSAPTLNDATHDYLTVKTREDAAGIAQQFRFHDLRERRAPTPKRGKPKLKAISSPPIQHLSASNEGKDDPGSNDRKPILRGRNGAA